MLMDRKITFDDYRGIIRALRDPEKGCPWDKAQTHESLKPCMIHEMTEAVAAVNLLSDTGDADNLSEELGDVLLQVVLQSQIAEEEGLFSLDDVIQKAGEKMIRRHPHVFPLRPPRKRKKYRPLGGHQAGGKAGKVSRIRKAEEGSGAECFPRSHPSSAKRNHSKKSRISLDKRPKTVYK